MSIWRIYAGAPQSPPPLPIPSYRIAGCAGLVSSRVGQVEPQLKESLFKGLAACQVFYCQVRAVRACVRFLVSCRVVSSLLSRFIHTATAVGGFGAVM